MALLGSIALLEKYGRVGGSVSLWGVGFEVLCAEAIPSVEHSLLLLTADQDVELLAPPAPCLPAHCHILP